MDRVSKALDKPEQLAELRNQMQTQLFLFDCLRSDGRKIPIELRLVLVWDNIGAFEAVLGVGLDISQQRRAEKDHIGTAACRNRVCNSGEMSLDAQPLQKKHTIRNIRSTSTT